MNGSQRTFLELQFVTFRRSLLGQCHVMFFFMIFMRWSFHIKRFLFSTLSRDNSFTGSVVQKIVLCCSDSIVQNLVQQPDDSCKFTCDTHFCNKLFKNESQFFCKHKKNYIVSKEYCFATHGDKMCFPSNCRWHILLVGNIKELLQKLDAFCFNY